MSSLLGLFMVFGGFVQSALVVVFVKYDGIFYSLSGLCLVFVCPLLFYPPNTVKQGLRAEKRARAQ